MKQMMKGFTLTECLVSFVLSMLLVLILTGHFLSIGRAYRMVHATLHESMAVQWVFDVLRQEIRHAGFTPCIGLNQLERVDTRMHPMSLDAVQIETGKIPKLVIQKMSEKKFDTAEILTPDTLHVKQLKLSPGRAILIADCKHAEVHDAEKSGDIIQLKQPLFFEYDKAVYVGEWISTTFFLKKAKGLMFEQHRVDFMMSIKSIEFKQVASSIIINMVGMLGKSYVLNERMRM